MGILSKVLRRAPAETSEPEQVLPEDLERFRMPAAEHTVKDREFHTFARRMTGDTPKHASDLPLAGASKHPSDFPPIGIPVTIEEAFRKEDEFQEKMPPPERPDKLDLIISKLETIDERLKVVEERLARRIV